MKQRCVFLLPIALMCLSFRAAADVTVTSPDGHVQFLLSPERQGHLEYTVTFNSRNIIDPSPLGIVVDKVDLADGRAIGAAESYKVNETYPWYGPHSTATDNCNGAKVAVTLNRGHPIRSRSGPTTTAWRSAISCRARASGRPTKPQYSASPLGA